MYALRGYDAQNVFDCYYHNDGECKDGTEHVLRIHQTSQQQGGTITLSKVGLQLFDIVTFTDARCAVSSELYRVRVIDEVYDTTKPPLLYRQTITLGGALCVWIGDREAIDARVKARWHNCRRDLFSS